jgi:hypothetical protein
VYDALKVSLDALKKESIRERMASAWNSLALGLQEKSLPLISTDTP